MRSGSKQVYFQSWPQVIQAVKELVGQPHRFQSQLRNIIVTAFGSDSHQGLIHNKINYYYTKNPIYWAEEVGQILKMFSPSGELLSGNMGIIASADYQIPINPKLLPKSVLNEFSERGDKNSNLLRSLKRERGQQYFVNTWEWFWIHVAQALVNLPEVEENRSLSEDEKEDEMFYIFSRNPILLIVRQALEYTRFKIKDSQLYQRLQTVFELYIVQDLLSSTRINKSRPDTKFQLKSHHIATMFLLIHSHRGNISSQILTSYHEYFQKATQHFGKLSSERNTHLNLRNLIRTYTFFLTRDRGLDHHIINQLENSNPTQGWYRLERCPIDKWVKAAITTDILPKEYGPITLTRNNIYYLLKKYSEWTPSFSFLSVLEQFASFDKTRITAMMRASSPKEENQILIRCFQRILIHLAQVGADCRSLQTIQARLNLKFQPIWQRQIGVNFDERSQQSKQKLSRTSRQQSKSVSYQNPRLKNVWQHPTQQNEYQILLKGSLWVATQLDRLIPGHSKRAYPCINIRIFANPLVFFVCFLVVFLLVRSYCN